MTWLSLDYDVRIRLLVRNCGHIASYSMHRSFITDTPPFPSKNHHSPNQPLSISFTSPPFARVHHLHTYVHAHSEHHAQSHAAMRAVVVAVLLAAQVGVAARTFASPLIPVVGVGTSAGQNSPDATTTGTNAAETAGDVVDVWMLPHAHCDGELLHTFSCSEGLHHFARASM